MHLTFSNFRCSAIGRLGFSQLLPTFGVSEFHLVKCLIFIEYNCPLSPSFGFGRLGFCQLSAFGKWSVLLPGLRCLAARHLKTGKRTDILLSQFYLNLSLVALLVSDMCVSPTRPKCAISGFSDSPTFAKFRRLGFRRLGFRQLSAFGV